MELQVIDITIREANDKIKHLENLYEYWLNEKERAFENTQPKANDMMNEMVQGGTTREDRNIGYLIRVEEIDKNLAEINKEKSNLLDYVANEVKRIGKEEPITRQIVEMRLKDNTWRDISQNIGLCESYCRKLFKKHVEKRFID